jgi:hypothetical protein
MATRRRRRSSSRRRSRGSSTTHTLLWVLGIAAAGAVGYYIASNGGLGLGFGRLHLPRQ